MNAPAGLRSYSYAEEKSVFRTTLHKWLLAIAVAALLFAPTYLSGYWLGLFSLTGIVVIALTGMNIIGSSGQVNLGWLGFMAVGAYFSAVMTGQYNQQFFVGLIGAGLLSGVLGMVFALPQRKKLPWVLPASFIFQILLLLLINHWTITGGTEGLSVPYPSVGFINFNTITGLYFLVVSVMGLSIFFANNLLKTRTGRAFTAVRDNPRAAQAMGIDLFGTRALAMFLGCFTAGIAGSLLAHWSGFITSGNFSLLDSFLFLGVILVFGLGKMWAPVFGAILFLLVTRIIAPWLAGTNLSPNAPLPFAATLYGAIIIFAVAAVYLVMRRQNSGLKDPNLTKQKVK
jgi:branched-chain amino acid transport system permease protein